MLDIWQELQGSTLTMRRVKKKPSFPAKILQRSYKARVQALSDPNHMNSPCLGSAEATANHLTKPGLYGKEAGQRPRVRNSAFLHPSGHKQPPMK
jgi:hypothetical protein